jgi:cell division protein FtsX
VRVCVLAIYIFFLMSLNPNKGLKKLNQNIEIQIYEQPEFL